MGKPLIERFPNQFSALLVTMAPERRGKLRLMRKVELAYRLVTAAGRALLGSSRVGRVLGRCIFLKEVTGLDAQGLRDPIERARGYADASILVLLHRLETDAEAAAQFH